MSRPKTTATGKGGRREESGKDSALDGSAGADGPRLGDRVLYACPFCDDSANATFKLDRYGSPEWLIGCWSPGCDGRHLPTLCDALGLADGATKAQIVAALRSLGRQARRRGEPEPLPSDAAVMGWQARLTGPNGREARQYLKRRGVSRSEIQNNLIGWDGVRLTFPMFPARGVAMVAFKTRVLMAGSKMRSLRGEREWPLYPAVDSGHARGAGWTLLVAGEFDALAARSAGLPASSVTVGAQTWREEWTEELRGLHVVVCFDNNEQPQAREVVARLREADLRAERLDLRTLGLDTPKGDLNDYLRAGGDPSRLRPRRRTIRRGRGSS